MAKLTDRELDFLARVHVGARLRLADREEDRIRQKMRRDGYAKVLKNPRRWVVTDLGRQALTDNRRGE